MGEGRLSVLIDFVIVDPAGQVLLLPEDRTLSRSTRVAQNVFVLRLVKVVVVRFVGCTVFAVDFPGDFYLRHANSVSSCIAKVGSAGLLVHDELGEEDSTGLAVDPVSNTAFVDNITSVADFDSEGTLLERLGEEGGIPHIVSGAGIAVDASSGFLFVADSGACRIVVSGRTYGLPCYFSEGFVCGLVRRFCLQW